MPEAFNTDQSEAGGTVDMIAIPDGTFLMGSEDFYPEEMPVRHVEVRGFLIDPTPVTNRAFARFVAASGYTTSAENPPDPAQYPGMPEHMAQAGSLVFSPAQSPNAWDFVFGADWRHPTGPSSDIAHLMDHPVVHITLTDALAYAKWAGKQIPSEAEWEYAARGGLEGATYAWGEDFRPQGRAMAKTWEGLFPFENTAPNGLERTAPVRSYPPNGYGLYDMIGNVWEWTSERLTDATMSEPSCCGKPKPPSPDQRFVTKGGSHLCAPNYCQRYRPAAKWGQSADTSTSHLGFRCIIRP